MLVLVAATSSARADVDLFPKNVLEAHSQSDTVERAPDPAWRSVERAAFSRFSPTVREITSDSPPELLAKQLARRREAHGGARPRGEDASRATSVDPAALLANREAQVDAVQAAYEEPVVWQRTEIEVRVDPQDGVHARIAHSSGRAALDAAALDAVERAARAGSGLGAVTATFVVESGVSVAMPARAANYEVQPRPKGVLVPVVRGRFGAGRKTEVTGPLQPRVRTRVSVTSLSR